MNSSGTVTKVNVFALDGLVARGLGSTWTYYSFDPQGSVAQRTNASGSVTSSSKYEAYGKHVNIPGSTTDVYGWNARWGYYFDSETGLYLCQQRYYDSSQGRWLNRDPIRYAGGVNVYGYCSGGPIGGVDSTGLRGMGESLAIGLANVISKLPPWAQNMLGGLGIPVQKLLDRLTSPGLSEEVGELVDDTTKVLDDCLGMVGKPIPFNPPAPPIPGAGPHTTLIIRDGRFTQGWTWDGIGRLIGRTDLTHHGNPGTHAIVPHFHPYPDGWQGGGIPIPWWE